MEQYINACRAKQEEYDRLPKQNLLVTFEMATPFSTIDYIRLDGILSYFSLRELLGQDFYNLPDSTEDPLIAPLPLEQCENDDKQWWWACSFGANSSNIDFVTRWKKRWDDDNDDLVDFGKKLPRVNHKAGQFKAYDMPLIIKCAHEIIFCCKGNMHEIERLLQDCHYIGKKRSQGFGEIKRIIVSETGQAWHSWSEEGKPTRAIPVAKSNIGKITKETGGISLAQMAYRPPYWHPKNMGWCYPL